MRRQSVDAEQLDACSRVSSHASRTTGLNADARSHHCTEHSHTTTLYSRSPSSSSSSLVHAVRVAAGPVRLGHAVRGRLRPFSFVPREAFAVRGERRRALREASRAGSRVLRRAKSVTRSHFFLSGRCDRAPTPSFCMPAVVKHSKNLCEGFSQPLGARGKPSGSVSSASLEAIRHSMSTACECSNDVGCTCLAPLAQYREQLCLSYSWCGLLNHLYF
jgi:hypothetical protein